MAALYRGNGLASPLETFVTGATGSDETVTEGDRIIGASQIVIDHETSFIVDGATAEETQAAKDTLAASRL